jgi:hypothetical protein
MKLLALGTNPGKGIYLCDDHKQLFLSFFDVCLCVYISDQENEFKKKVLIK